MDDEYDNYGYDKEDGQSFNKLWAYFKDLIKEVNFLKDTNNVKNKYKDKYKDFSVYEDFLEDYPNFTKDVDKIANKYNLDPLGWFTTLAVFILENELIKPPSNFNYTDLCQVSDFKELEYETNKSQIQKQANKLYPVIVRISPYATRNDILDFIKKNYTKTIKDYQNKFKNNKSNIGKKKKKSTLSEERVDFIFENRELPLKEISRLIVEKFGREAVLDQGYIGKVISREKNKRNLLS